MSSGPLLSYKSNENSKFLNSKTLTTYHVFGKRDQEHDFERVGQIQAPNDTLAEFKAMKVFDEHDWIEMSIVPDDALIRFQVATTRTGVMTKLGGEYGQ